jgi:beta-glucosidase
MITSYSVVVSLITSLLTSRAIPALIKSGEMKESVLDEAVRRVLRIKFRLGLFERPYFKEIAEGKAFLLPG